MELRCTSFSASIKLSMSGFQLKNLSVQGQRGGLVRSVKGVGLSSSLLDLAKFV